MPVATRPPPLSALIAITAIGPMALNIYLPSMPGLQRVFATDYATVQLSLTLFLTGFAAAQLVYGPLSDRFGRRPVLLAGLGLFMVGSMICLIAPTIETLIAGRMVQAIGGCSGMVLARAIVRDVYERDRVASMLAYVLMAMVAAPMLSPAIGGYLDVWFGWRANSVFALAFGAAVLGCAVRSLPETNPRIGQFSGAAELAQSFATLLRRRAFHGYAWQIAFTSAVFFIFIGGAPYVMVEVMGRPPSDYGLYFIAIAGMLMLGNLAAGRISVRVGVDRMIVIGALITFVGAALEVAFLAAGALTPLTMSVAMAICAVGNGISQANGFAGAVSVDPQRAGAASGLAGFLQWALGAGATYMLGALLADTAMPLAAGMLVFAALSLVAYALGVWRG